MTWDVAEELRGPLGRIPPIAFGSSVARKLFRAAGRLMPATRVEGVILEVVKLGGRELRVHRPDAPRSDAALLWIHGGGYLIGRPVQDDRFCAGTALALGITVVAPGYGLAPEHPFPGPLDDCYAAWEWLRGQGFAAGRIAVGGQSAGGGLAAALVQRLHDEGATPAAQLLLCPMLDDRTAALPLCDRPVWDNAKNAIGWRAYLGQEPGAASLPPYASPARREDLGDLPPAWIGVGEIDLFLDENRIYAERLRASGVAAELLTVPGAPHGFEAWAADSALARAFVSAARGWLGRALG